uniref:Uncharacterized protein n=1 Tax=Aegilops tauschii TaxID=37682 RepID=M8BH11_AEGTA
MASGASRTVRFQSDVDVKHFRASPLESPQPPPGRKRSRSHDPRRWWPGSRDSPEKPRARTSGGSGRALKDRVLSRAFSEELESLMHAGGDRHLFFFFDPRGQVIHRWHKVFLAACLASLFLAPLVLSRAGTRRDACVGFDYSLALTLSMIRSLLDVFYAAHIVIRFRTAFIAPSSRVFGRGELVINPYQIARRYLAWTFWFDLFTALPLPQDCMMFGCAQKHMGFFTRDSSGSSANQSCVLELYESNNEDCMIFGCAQKHMGFFTRDSSGSSANQSCELESYESNNMHI